MAAEEEVVFETGGITERGEYLAYAEKVKPFAEKFGFPDYNTLMQHVGSNGVLALKVVDELLQEKFGFTEAAVSAPTEVAEPAHEEPVEGAQ